MNRQRIPMYLALLLPVVVIILIFIRDSGGDAPADVELIRVFPQLTDADLQTIHLYDPAAPQDGFVITRSNRDAPWRTPGGDQPLDAEQVEVMAVLIAQLEFHEIIEAEDADYVGEGLVGEGSFVVEFITFDGTEHHIYVGDLRESGLAFPVRIDDDTRVFIMQRAQIDLLKNWYAQPPLAQ